MSHLTREIEGTGEYASAAHRADLIQRLGDIEKGAGQLIEAACERNCRFPFIYENQVELDKKCEICPLDYLQKLIDGEYRRGSEAVPIW